MDQEKTHVSYSQLRMFNKCKKKWQLKYRDGLKPPSDSVHTIGGTAFHETIQEYLERCVYGDESDMDLRNDFKHRLKSVNEDVKEQEEWKNVDHDPATKKQLIEYCKATFNILKEFKESEHLYFDPEYTELVGIEVPIEHDLSQEIVWVGYLDVVLKDRDTGKYIIIDIKTSTSGWSKWDKDDAGKANQVVAYKNFYSDKLGIPKQDIEVKYWIAAREPDWNWTNSHFEEFSPEDDEWTISQLQSNIEHFLNTAFYFPDGEYVKQDFDPEPDKFTCCFCPYSQQFSSGEHAVCDQDGMIFDGYPKKMKNYIDEKWCK